MRADIHGGQEHKTLQSEAGYIDARPPTARPKKLLATHGRTIHGGQGTLGGLSSMAERVGQLLDRATKRLALCSNDPICAEHGEGNEDYPLQGAACHACLLVPETSCESRNTR